MRLSFPLRLDGSRPAARPRTFSPEAFVSAIFTEEGKALSPELRAELGERNFQEILCLSQEQDPVTLASSLIDLGIRFEDQDKSPWALKIYEAVKQLAKLLDWENEISRPLRKEAERAEAHRLKLLEEGPLFERVEGFLKRLVRNSTSLEMIAPMMAGTMVGGLAKAFSMGRLAARGEGVWYARGLGAKFAANAFAYAFEVPTFALTSHALGAQGPISSLGREFKSTAISLGWLKVFGAMGNQVYAKLHGVGALGEVTRLAGLARWNQAAIGQAATLTGMLLAQKTEERMGLRTPADRAASFVDLLGSAWSMGMGAYLGDKILGEGYARWNLEWELRMEMANTARSKIPPFQERIPATVVAGKVLSASPLAEEAFASPWSPTLALLRNRENETTHGTSGSSSPQPRGKKVSNGDKQLLLGALDVYAAGENQNPYEHGLSWEGDTGRGKEKLRITEDGLARLNNGTLTDKAWRNLWRGLVWYFDLQAKDTAHQERSAQAKVQLDALFEHLFVREGWNWNPTPIGARETLLFRARKLVAARYAGGLPEHPGIPGVPAQTTYKASLTRWLNGKLVKIPPSFYYFVEALLKGLGMEKAEVEKLIVETVKEGVSEHPGKGAIEIKLGFKPRNGKKMTKKDIDRIVRAIVAQDPHRVYRTGNIPKMFASKELSRRKYLIGYEILTLETLIGRVHEARGLKAKDKWRRKLFGWGPKERTAIPISLDFTPSKPTTEAQIDKIVQAIAAQDSELYPDGDGTKMMASSKFLYNHWYNIGCELVTLGTLIGRVRKARGLKGNDHKRLSKANIVDEWKRKLFGWSPEEQSAMIISLDFTPSELMTEVEIDKVVKVIVAQDSELYPDGDGTKMATSAKFLNREYLINGEKLSLETLIGRVRRARGLKVKDRSLKRAMVIDDWRQRLFGWRHAVVPISLGFEPPEPMRESDMRNILHKVVTQDTTRYPDGDITGIQPSPKFLERRYLINGKELSMETLISQILQAKKIKWRNRKELVRAWQRFAARPN